MGDKQVADISMPGEDQGGKAPVGTVTQHGNATMVSASHEEIVASNEQQKAASPLEKRLKDMQAAYTRSQQELAEYRSGKKKPAAQGDGIQQIADSKPDDQGIQKIVPDAQDPNAEPDTDVDSMLAKAKLTRKDVVAALDKNGQISDDHFKAIRKDYPWLSRKLANTLVAAELKDDAIKALTGKIARDRFTSLVGGAEGERAFYESARQLPVEQQVQLDKLLQEGHIEAAISHFKVLTGATGTPKTQAMIQGRPGASTSKGDISTLSEWREASRAAMNGDREAQARMGRVSNQKLVEWSRA